MTVERLIGRSLAMAVHPVLAWRRVRPAGRIGLLLAYFGASYFGSLVALFMLH